jgi:hypothetical protein
MDFRKEVVKMGLAWNCVQWWDFRDGYLEISGAAARDVVGNPASFRQVRIWHSNITEL